MTTTPTTPKTGDTGVAFCEQAGHEVLQEYVDNDWLCLHNDTKDQDLEEVKQFKNRNDGSN